MSDLKWNTPSSPVEAPIENQAHVWKFHFSQNFEHIDVLEELLSFDEKERARHYIFLKDRNRFILSRGILRLFCGHFLSIKPSDIIFKYGNYGKPYLHSCHSSKLQFNLSHSNDILLVCFTYNLYIGIDVEKTRSISDWQNIANIVFSHREKQVLDLLPEEQKTRAFFKAWTYKEAYIKALGNGLSIPLNQIEVSLEPDARSSIIASNIYTEKKFSIQEFFCHPTYASAIAIEEGLSDILKFITSIDELL